MPRRNHRGTSLVYCTVALVALIGVLGLAVDLGRVQLAKSELQTQIDAAARHAATGLRDGTWQAKALSAGNDNTVDGRSLALLAGEVVSGQLDATTGTLTPNATPANAVRITVQRSGAQGVPTVLANVIGISSVSLRASSVAYDSGVALAAGQQLGFTGGLKGFVGTDWFNINGSLAIRAWDSTTGTVSPAGSWAVGQTQGNINLNSGVYFEGEIQKAANSSVSMNSATVTRGFSNLPSALNYPMPTTPSGTTNLGNYNGPSGNSGTLPGGKYYLDSFSLPTGKTLTFTGPAELYVNGSFSVSGTIVTHQSVPGNLKVNIVSGAGCDLSSNSGSPLYMDVYAPGSPFNLGNRTFYGSLVCKGINVNSAFSMYVDRRSYDQSGTLQTTNPSQAPQNGAVNIVTGY
jgi:Flp pilus assembly protein TadG